MDLARRAAEGAIVSGAAPDLETAWRQAAIVDAVLSSLYRARLRSF